MSNTSDLEDRSIKLAGDAARGPFPDVGISGMLAKVVREAYKRGYEAAASELADAYSLYLIEDDDLDGFRDALTDRIPKGWKVPKPRRKRNPK